MKLLKVFTLDGELVTDSRDVAKIIGRKHKEVLAMIEGQVHGDGRVKHIGFLPIISESGLFNPTDFFIESSYKANGNNRTYKSYLLTRKGCNMLANKMTGEKGVLFTADYVTRFEEMERNIIPLSVKEQFIESMRFSISTAELVQLLGKEMVLLNEKVDNQITLDHGQQRLLQQLISKKVYEFALSKEHKALLFSELHREIKDRFGVSSYKDVKRKELQTVINYLESWLPKKVINGQKLG